jgi:hypothetical protein
LAAQELSQLVLTEPDAKLMRTARHGHQVAYNAQTVVDADNKLIVAFSARRNSSIVSAPRPCRRETTPPRTSRWNEEAQRNSKILQCRD